MDPRAIVHMDLDAFFVQVERSRNPALLHVPLAVQQHQDTIAISYEARQLGIKKAYSPDRHSCKVSASTIGACTHHQR
jgi:nucleotidyltransferase/DNA polymerase involved in DNA repair